MSRPDADKSTRIIQVEGSPIGVEIMANVCQRENMFGGIDPCHVHLLATT